MTVGAAQILLKTSNQVPADPVWIAGSGPLVLLYIKQLLEAGGTVAGWLDTSPADSRRRGIPHFLSALRNWRDLRKGYRWLRAIRKAGVPVYAGVAHDRAEGEGRMSEIVFSAGNGPERRVPAKLLLVHEGVVPSINMSSAIECQHAWVDKKRCFAPQVEGGGGAQARVHSVLDNALANAPAAQQALLDAPEQVGVRHRRFEQPDADDHHQVRRRVHPQPGGIDTRHALRRGGGHRRISSGGARVGGDDAR